MKKSLYLHKYNFMIFLTEIDITITQYMCDGEKKERQMYLVEAEDEADVRDKVMKKYVSDPYGTYYNIDFNFINEMIR